MGDVSPVRRTADEGREKRLHSGSNGGRGKEGPATSIDRILLVFQEYVRGGRASR